MNTNSDIAHIAYGAGTPVVLLPWFGLDGSVTATAFEPAFLHRPGWRRYYPSLPGCGDSPPGPPDSDGVLDAVVAWVRAEIGDAPFLLGGCSYGGYLAAGLARRMPVSGLLLVGHAVRIMHRNLPDVPPPPAESGWLANVPPQWHEHLDRALGNRTAAVAERVAGLLENAAPVHEDYLDRLRANGYRLSDEDSPADFPGPVCVLAGRNDHIAGYADQLAVGYPDATCVALANTGHYLPFEQPSLFAHLVADWLDRCRTE